MSDEIIAGDLHFAVASASFDLLKFFCAFFLNVWVGEVAHEALDRDLSLRACFSFGSIEKVEDA